MRGNLWAQLLMLGSFAAYSDAKRERRIKIATKTAGQAAVAYAKASGDDPTSPECIAEVKQVAIEAGQAVMHGATPQAAIRTAVNRGLNAPPPAALAAEKQSSWEATFIWGLVIFFVVFLLGISLYP
jgi:hypothetical protein